MPEGMWILDSQGWKFWGKWIILNPVFHRWTFCSNEYLFELFCLSSFVTVKFRDTNNTWTIVFSYFRSLLNICATWLFLEPDWLRFRHTYYELQL